MNTQHTPGPWKTDIPYRGDKYRYVIADQAPFPHEIARLEVARGQTEANARLIAAAPELLESLIEVTEILPCLFEGTRTPEPGSIGGKAMAAIAKATGAAA